VEARVVTWSAEDVVTAPLAALFRESDAWAAFVVRDGRARLTPLEVGHRNSTQAEILAGLEPGDLVLLHPAAEIVDGTRVTPRSTTPALEPATLPAPRGEDGRPLAEGGRDGRGG
jgi:HlyD family secretion protein